GLRAAPGDIIVVTGVAQALALLARVLRARGLGEIAVEDPGSRGARDDLAYWGLRPVPVPVDEHGMRVSELTLGQARAALLTPAHQFPTGVVRAPPRRRHLPDWAAAPDRPSRGGDPLRALREHLPQARVQGVAAGLHLLITFPGLDGSDADLAEAILRTGVLVQPLSWHRQRPGVPGFVLGYAAHTPDRLHEAA